MLQQHQQLSVLQLTNPLGHAAAQHVCRLGGLRELSVSLASGQSASCLADLPSSITRLRVSNYRNYYDHWAEYHSIDEAPSDVSEEDDDAWWNLSRMQLVQLTGLVDLHLWYVAISAAELAGATQMQRLVLGDCTLLPQGEHDAAEGIGNLLSTLAGYTQLLHLRLEGLDFGKRCGSLAAERFAALTASPMLTYLEISGEDGRAPLPSGAVQHMFPAGLQLPLRELVLLPSTCQEEMISLNAESCCITGAELSNMFSSCRELELLHITGAVHPGDMSGLLQLPPSCTELCIGGPALCDAAVPVVGQLTHLKVLRCGDSPGLTDVGLQQLTALTGLSALEIERCDGLSDEVGGPSRFERSCYLCDGGDEPVWRQLQALCKISPQLEEAEDAAG